MPRLSMWRTNKTNDYKFFDKAASEMYTVGGMDMYIHLYLGPKTQSEDTGDATLPVYTHTDPLFIEDLLLLENRDRDYDESIYRLRGVYNVIDIDFDLSQFGLFIAGDTLFITWHYNDMIDTIGRKLMNGDVIEIPNLRDYHPLDASIPKALPKFYVVQDAAFAAEGFSQTWLPHLWRTKCIPLVASQEYSDIIGQPLDPNNPGAGSIFDNMSTGPKDQEINDTLITQAEAEVPLSGYDVSKFYVLPTDETGRPIPIQPFFNPNWDIETPPRANGWTMGYLTGEGEPPNGFPVIPGMSYPINPTKGDFCLRLDYHPNRLFRYDGARWVRIEDNVRTPLTNGPDNLTQRSNFVNNDATVPTTDRGDIPSRQGLSKILRPKADN